MRGHGEEKSPVRSLRRSEPKVPPPRYQSTTDLTRKSAEYLDHEMVAAKVQRGLDRLNQERYNKRIDEK